MIHKKIEYYKHNLTSKDIAECSKVLHSLFLTTGNTVMEFENKFAEYIGLPHVIGVTSCTDALFLALKYYGITSGDEVITSTMTFISAVNTIEFCGAKPVFVDADPKTGNIAVDDIEKRISKRTKAIMVTHLYGQMCDMREIARIAKKHKLPVIEDSAHCVEGSYNGVRPGQLGDIACFSFYATKNLTSGEGGAVACKSAKIAEWMRKARLHGMSKGAADRYMKTYKHYDMEFLGYKCNMNNIQASLLVHQIDRLETYLKKKEAIAQKLTNAFKNNNSVRIPAILPNTKHARHIYTIWVDAKKRDEYMHELQEKGIGIAVHFRPVHLMKYYKEKYGYKKGDFPSAEKIGAETITLPFYPKLTSEEINYLIASVNSLH